MKAVELPTDIDSAHSIINQQALEIQNLQQQVDWFKNQLFGRKSEKIIRDSSSPNQLWLGGEAPAVEGVPEEITVKEHVRRQNGKQALEDNCGESGLRFDSSVPVEEKTLEADEVKGLPSEAYEFIENKITEQLCQRSGSYYVKRTIRPVVKIKACGKVTNAPAPATVLEKSYADVTLLAGILVDKVQYHLPLYRQHQRMEQAGVKIARANLTNWFHRTADLLRPIYQAVMVSVLESTTLAMDETPLKAGKGKKAHTLHKGYVWVMYGDRDELLFLYSPTRAVKAVEQQVKQFCGTLLTDGYTAYDKLCAAHKALVHAYCWAHARREFYEGLKYEPQLCQKALDYISKLYEEEAKIRDSDLADEEKLRHRVEQERPIVDTFFDWLKAEVAKNSLLPSNRFYKAANYALEREQGLRVYLADPEVQIDTNHLERGLRPIPMGRKAWLFCWTEVGAEALTTVHTLISCCKLHGVNPFEYLVDVLQRIDTHPASAVAELTPRCWAAAKKFANS